MSPEIRAQRLELARRAAAARPPSPGPSLLGALLRDLIAGASRPEPTPEPPPPELADAAPTSDPPDPLEVAWSLATHPLSDDAGVVYTPRRLALALADAALHLLPRPRHALDPACGAGALLLALRELRPDTHLYGVDAAPAAVATARLALTLAGVPPEDAIRRVRCADGLAPRSDYAERFPAPFADGGFDLVLANPPYIRAPKREARALRERFQTARGAFDLYVPFLEHIHHLRHPRGAHAVLTSNKFLVADYGRALRQLIAAQDELRLLLDLASDDPFDALIEPALLLASPRAARCTLALALEPLPEPRRALRALLALEPGDTLEDATLTAEAFPRCPFPERSRGPWPLLALGRRRRLLEQMTDGRDTLGERFEVRTGVMGFDYKAVCQAVSDGGDGPRAITCGLLRPRRLLWGEKDVRLSGRRLLRPTLSARPEALSDATWAWFHTPKVLIPGVARGLLAAADPEGRHAPLVAVHGVAAEPALLTPLAHLLCSAPMRWIYRVRYGGARIPRGSRRIGVGMIRALPLPAEPEVIAQSLSQLSQKSDVAALVDQRVAELFGLKSTELQQIQNDLDTLV